MRTHQIQLLVKYMDDSVRQEHKELVSLIVTTSKMLYAGKRKLLMTKSIKEQIDKTWDFASWLNYILKTKEANFEVNRIPFIESSKKNWLLIIFNNGFKIYVYVYSFVYLVCSKRVFFLYFPSPPTPKSTLSNSYNKNQHPTLQ